ncbi:TauD/TfdA family dioxygenase [Streptomyces jumonjinensis]|uniref:TauD/TfdA family dioxygenase n=1 Tax=Streptomyces jumonjinensis TaxID=1945 RepID=A0A646KTJ6_STRJU|nr:TauD/TfdA family dioxygenase [Streptomyces jumonjinensis]MQT05420.1 TauD/TfdA family dioxygenase [Streptomyces jumonjinensis]
MTTAPSTYRAPLPETLVELLGRKVIDLPPAELEGGLLRGDVSAAYDRVRAESPEAQIVVRRCRDLLDDPDGDGFAVLEVGLLLGRLGLDDGQKAATVLLSWLGAPLRAFDRWPLWKPLGTNLTIDPMRATGSGYNPLHIDVVNATEPPDYSALLCVRPDPLGEGNSIVSHLRRAVDRLNDDERALLAEPVFHDGAFYDLTGVGTEYDPFPVLDGLPASEGFVRFTAKMLPDMDLTDPHTSAARELERELISEQQKFLLGFGDLIVVNQHLCVHGREPLGHGQEEVPEEQRRLLWQMFLRAAEAVAR